MEENHLEKLVEAQEVVDQLRHDYEDHYEEALSDISMDGSKFASSSHDLDDCHVNEQNECMDYCFASEGQIIVDTIESELPSNGRDGEMSLSEPKWLEGDKSVALWVKWRGTWQAGIKCARADWPLSTLKAKPTHDRKKYFVIFFPRTKNYSWANMLLVCSINEFPQPIAYRTHKIGLKMVKDLTVAHRFIMRKLVVGMLNIIDQLHMEALIESARQVLVWKIFATETSHCNGYLDLGKMLLKLQNMILPCYMNSEWIQHSLSSWAQRCENAHSAETIEILKEELFDSILWNEVNSLRDPSMQFSLGSEWKTWKHEAIRWFSTSSSASNAAEINHLNDNDHIVQDVQVARKRPKLEVRRAEVHNCCAENKDVNTAGAVEIDSEFFKNADAANSASFMSESFQVVHQNVGGESVTSPRSVADKWDDLVVEDAGTNVVQSDNALMTLKNDAKLTVVAEKHSAESVGPVNRNRQCIAFVEAKGRQCIRLANEGDVYCCIHLASRFSSNSSRAEKTLPVDTPPCQATTVLGTKCKHRSLPGITYCKKHRPKNDFKSDSNALEKMQTMNLKSLKSNLNMMEYTVVGQDENSVLDTLVVVPPSEKYINEKHDDHGEDVIGMEVGHDIGLCLLNKFESCMENAKRYSLYCDKHLPSWLKRARNGKSRIISREVFLDILRDCSSEEQKMRLHQACELFFKLFKSILSVRNPVPLEVQLQWAHSEASKDKDVGELLMKLVWHEKDRLRRIWGFGIDEGGQNVPPLEQSLLPQEDDGSVDDGEKIKCKICFEEFPEDQILGGHWMENHKKEAQWLFRGYACAICLDSYTNKKVLETHVQERHHVQFVEQCKLLQCIPCGSHFGNTEELWSHILSVHPADFRLSKVSKQHNPVASVDSPWKAEPLNSQNADNNVGGMRRFICRFCGLRFDLLPDLGRHHQAAHMGPSLARAHSAKKGLRHYAYKLKSGRLTHPKFKKGLGAVSYRIRTRGRPSLKKRIQASKSLSAVVSSLQPHEKEGVSHSRLGSLECSSIAKMLYSHIEKTKPRPNNHDILSVARFACCKESIKAHLERVFGVLPERLYLKAAKLCSEQNINLSWHLNGFVCPNGCKPSKENGVLLPLESLPMGHIINSTEHGSDPLDNEWEVDESHYVLDMHQIKPRNTQNAIILCDDISFGQESVPVTCVVDEWLFNSLHFVNEGGHAMCAMPWEGFSYNPKPLIDRACLQAESLQLGCSCTESACSPESCAHVYLFDNDYEDAKDIYGKSMRGRFPYDEGGHIILEEGYLVYECNNMCHCKKTCQNRVLQNGVRVKLEVFKTERKGWAVRAGEAILRGTFVCEYVGEVLDELEAEKRRNSYGKDGCSYLYDINSHINDMSRLIEGEVRYAIDATKYGNVSRFINHSCSPNLVNHQVLLESMDCQRVHIGLYANRDIALGEELTYDYQYELLPGEGYPCYCEASNCRGRLY